MVVVEIVVVVVVAAGAVTTHAQISGGSLGLARLSQAKVHGGGGGGSEGMRVVSMLVATQGTMLAMTLTRFLPTGVVDGGYKGRCRLGVGARIGAE